LAANLVGEKHYTMGRKAWELSIVLPDRKTTYGTDDGASGVLNKFVATTAGSLNSGTLYCAKFTQTSTAPLNGGTFTISWIQLGALDTTDTTIKAAIDARIKFTDIFDTEIPVSGTCPTVGFTFITLDSASGECLKVKAGMDTIASRLETRRYSAMMGCTVEFNKMEGLTHDSTNNVMYMAISNVDKAMYSGYTAKVPYFTTLLCIPTAYIYFVYIRTRKTHISACLKILVGVCTSLLA
jgi:hypothetical protein